MIIDNDNAIHSVDAGHICSFLIRRERKRIELPKSGAGGIPIGISNDTGIQIRIKEIGMFLHKLHHFH